VTAPAAPPAPQGDVALAYFFWEESHVPQTLANTLNQFDGVLVPADFIRSALIDSGVTKPIIDVGFSPNLEPFSALYGKPSNGQRKARPFTFLHVSSCFPRKGVDVLLTAYARAFRNTDNVRLIIKKPKAAKRPDVESIKVLNPDMAELILMEEDIDVGAMRNLYLEADAVVSPSRGEGFNLPAAEAIAAGMHLIVTGYGGHMQFCRPEVARLLRYTMAPSMQPNSLWAEPDVDDLCAALREAKEGKTDRDPKARDDILALLGGKAWIARIMDAIDKVAGTAS
jgi:glycosyltransferase involved in cell wall biosynthesis